MREGSTRVLSTMALIEDVSKACAERCSKEVRWRRKGVRTESTKTRGSDDDAQEDLRRWRLEMSWRWYLNAEGTLRGNISIPTGGIITGFRSCQFLTFTYACRFTHMGLVSRTCCCTQGSSYVTVTDDRSAYTVLWLPYTSEIFVRCVYSALQMIVGRKIISTAQKYYSQYCFPHAYPQFAGMQNFEFQKIVFHFYFNLFGKWLSINVAIKIWPCCCTSGTKYTLLPF